MKKAEWWGWLDLNQRPTGYEPAALTTELHPLVETYFRFSFCRKRQKLQPVVVSPLEQTNSFFKASVRLLV